jgi:4'-phosphopantetheinyl transferase
VLDDLPPFRLAPVAPPRLPLGPDEVHVWCAFADAFADEPVRTRLTAVLSDDERARMQRFVRERDRRLQMLARAMMRILLSAYSGVPPDAWRFRAGAHGKPEIASPTIEPPIGFNLSHTDGLVAAAFARCAEVGVDVEWLDRRAATADVARRFFAAAEVEHLESTPDERRTEAFFAFWTLKEAYLKARGLGLSVPLSSFAFDLDAHEPRVTFAPSLEDDQARWRFARYAPGPRHRLALAVTPPQATARRLRIGRVLPD